VTVAGSRAVSAQSPAALPSLEGNKCRGREAAATLRESELALIRSSGARRSYCALNTAMHPCVQLLLSESV